MSLLLYILFWPILFAVSTISFVARRCFALARGAFSKARADSPKAPAVLGYIPVELYAALSVLTCGLYPFSWLWSNSAAFTNLCANRFQEKRLRLYAVTGFCVQLLLPVSLALFLASRFTDSLRFEYFAPRFLLLYAASYLLLVFPQRCYHFFDLRWNIRRAVEAWDKDGVMISRTMKSWFKLFTFGSAYIQFHINRLIGLGMPGFVGQDEILREFSVKNWLNEYVIIKKRGVRISDEPGEIQDG